MHRTDLDLLDKCLIIHTLQDAFRALLSCTFSLTLFLESLCVCGYFDAVIVLAGSDPKSG